MEVPHDAREQETPTSYFCHFAHDLFPTMHGQSGINKSCYGSPRFGAYFTLWSWLYHRMPSSKKPQPLIFATLPSNGFMESMGKVVKIRVAPILLGLGHTYHKVMGVPKDAREQKT